MTTITDHTPPTEERTLPRWARAWELTPGARVGQRVVARTVCGPLNPMQPLPVVRVYWVDGEAENAAPSIFHPWQRMDSRGPSQPGARWLHAQCRAYARRHVEGWTLEGMRTAVLGLLEAGRSPVQITPKGDR